MQTPLPTFNREELNMFRRLCVLVYVLSSITAAALAQPAPAQSTPSTGSGPYTAIIEGDPGVPGHTIYRPGDLSPFSKKNPMPVMAWGNGGCSNSSQMHANFLAEVASHGYLVVAIGPYTPEPKPKSAGMMGGQTKSAQLLEALDWATAENNRSGSKYYGKVDPSKFAVAGMSCGGMQALEVSPDPRVATSLIMNSGLFAGGLPKMGAPKTGAPKTGAPKEGAAPKMTMALPTIGKDHLQKLHAPAVYIDGGKSDMAYENGEDDFARIDHVPIAIAHFDDVGHGGTYSQPNGGEFGKVAVAWLKWQLQGDETAKKMFAGSDCGLCKNAEWEYKKKKLQ